MSCQIYGMTTIECTLREHSIVMNKANPDRIGQPSGSIRVFLA